MILLWGSERTNLQNEMSYEILTSVQIYTNKATSHLKISFCTSGGLSMDISAIQQVLTFKGFPTRHILLLLLTKKFDIFLIWL